ncbi:MAG: carboxymuconolactone decarboxylase [Gammaproteobacteria bacterium]|nr:carboxymuconolactone decarboxylase family protein [Gammaproteobacteria bacterium]NNM00030.1 carboxymuconolactone decarboxylase [Gammaproteobacteria bacterium]
MARIPPLDIAEVAADLRPAIEAGEALLGFLSNDALIMARNPALLRGVLHMVQAVYAPGRVEPALKRLVGLMTSAAAGCRYCTAHTAWSAERLGVDADKLAALWDYERSDAFTAAERAALDVARQAAQAPGAVTDEIYDELRTHFDAGQQIEIVAVIAMFGFLNRWNATLATDIEAAPAARAAAMGLIDDVASVSALTPGGSGGQQR